MNDGAILAELDGVSKRFEAVGSAPAPEPLKGVHLRVLAGESVAIVGPSGSGKSTLLHLLGGLARPTSGTVRIDGQDLAVLDEAAIARFRNEKIGFVFQLHHLLPQCSVLENVLVPTLVQHRRTPTDLVLRARDLIDRVGLSERAEHRPGQLSGGECQRVAVARALINDPVLLLADEPTGALDSKTAERLADLLVDQNERHGVTLVAVTHWPRLAERTSRVLRLSDGCLHADGAPA